MAEFKTNLFFSKILSFFLFLLLIWTGIICVRTIYKKHQMMKEVAHLEADIIAIKEENNDLRELKSLLGNREYLEKEAKRRLNLKKEGEEVVIVPENNGEGIEIVDLIEGEKTEKELSNLEKWKIYFFK